MTDQSLEDMIDRAGRKKVFQFVRNLGWLPGEPVPVHVWQSACYLVSKTGKEEQ